MIYAAAAAFRAEGRAVIGVATTAKAVAELESAGLAAMTIARLRIDLADRPLARGTAIVVDEISQTSTRDAHTVLRAVAATDDAVLVVVGDPDQSQPVKAGGLAAEIAELAGSGRILAAEPGGEPPSAGPSRPGGATRRCAPAGPPSPKPSGPPTAGNTPIAPRPKRAPRWRRPRPLTSPPTAPIRSRC